MDDNHIVEIRDLVKNYPVGGGYFTALRDVTTDVAVGEFTGLVGPSGSGKTTLLNIIGGLDAPSEGSVTVLDMPLGGKHHKELAHLRREGIGF
ncbi:MAG: ATP-binding cassette domain-containing protein, partial [Fidelibacterota bacterium]